jgi:hypothetical protein
MLVFLGRGILIVSLLLAACSTSDAPSERRPGDRCLYGVEADYGRVLRWDSCAHPPPYSVRVGGPD